jgi:hypothetical protein
MVRAWVLVFSIFAVGTCVAAPMVLKCNAVWNGPIIQKLTVDLEERSMRWGDVGRYKIISMTDRYITGLEDQDDGVGGQIWVLDRDTGEYWRATVFLGWDSLASLTVSGGKPPTSPPPKTVQSATYHGKCNRPI